MICTKNNNQQSRNTLNHPAGEALSFFFIVLVHNQIKQICQEGLWETPNRISYHTGKQRSLWKVSEPETSQLDKEECL